MVTRLLFTLAALVLALAALAADSRYLVTLEGARADGASLTLALDYADGAFTMPRCEAAGLKLDGAKLAGELTLTLAGAACAYDIAATVEKTTVTGSYTGTCGDTAVKGTVNGRVEPKPTSSYPRWRGPNGDGSADDPGCTLVEDLRKAKLLWTSEQELPPSHDEGMKQIWTGGYASPVVGDGKVFLFHFIPHGRTKPQFTEDDVKVFGPTAKSQHGLKADAPWAMWHVDEIIQAFDAATGKTLWTYLDERGLTEIAGKSGGHHTACYDDGRVFVIGTTGRLYCLDANTGDRLWEAYPSPGNKDAYERSAKAGTSVLKGDGQNQVPCAIDGVVAVARDREWIVAFDAATGKQVWQVRTAGGYTVGGRGNGIAPVVWTHKGAHYIIAANTCIEPKTGKVRWAIPEAMTTTSPCVAEQYYVCSALRGADGKPAAGSTCYRITPGGYEKLWSLPKGRQPSMGCTDAISGDYFIQEASDVKRTALMVELATGKVVAEAASFRDVGYSPLTCRGVLYGGMYNATTMRLDPANMAVLKQGLPRAGWANSTSPALADGKLYFRTPSRLVCYDLRAEAVKE